MAYSKVTGVYKILCIATGKPYIGSAVSIKARWASHRYLLKHKKHPNKHLQNSWNKFGESWFEFAVIELCTEEERIAREQYWIDHFDASNQATGLNNSPTASTTVGYKHSVHTLELLQKLAKNRPATHLHQYRFPKGHQSFLGKKHTEATISRLRDAGKKRGTPVMAGWNAGVPMPQHIKAQISAKVSAKKVIYGEAHIAQAKVLRSAGLSYPKIAKSMGISTATAHRLITGSRVADQLTTARTFEKVKGVSK